MAVVSLLYVYPIFMVLINSLKVESAISTGTAFALPGADTFAGLDNYENAINSQGFLSSPFLYGFYHGYISGGYSAVLLHVCLVYHPG